MTSGFSVILVRHASTSASETRRLLGSIDEPLSNRGAGEAADVARALVERVDVAGGHRPGCVVTSPLTRAEQTAARIAEALGWRMEVAPGFAERNFGSWSGRGLNELARGNRLAIEAFVRDPLSVDPDGSEEVGAFRQRVLEGWRRVAALIDSGERVIIVAHDGPIRIVLRELGLGDSADVPLYGIGPCQCMVLSRSSDTRWELVGNAKAATTPGLDEAVRAVAEDWGDAPEPLLPE